MNAVMNTVSNPAADSSRPAPRLVAVPQPERARARAAHRPCNLCGQKFSPHNRFERFCVRCKEESALYHFADWMIAS